MRVYLDNTMCNVEAASVSQALASAAAVARKRGRAIVDVVIDGCHCPADTLDQQRLAQARAQEIHLTTADCRQLVRQAFDDASGALSEADRLQQEAAELLQSDRGPEAMRRLSEALDIWSNVRAAVLMGAEMGGIDLEADDKPGKAKGRGKAAGRTETEAEPGTHATIVALTERLRSLREALTQRDTVAAADTLLYDLPDVITAWRSMLCDLRQRVA